jgi:transcriptional regulator with XRE-family HTH domain
MAEHTDLTRLGAAMRALREEAGFSQEELGRRAGLHRTYVGMVERGERNATFSSLDRLLQACDVTWERFGSEVDQRGSSLPP